VSTPLERTWAPFSACPCGSCSVVSGKLSVRTGHVRGCACRSCLGRRSRAKGHRAQSRVLKDAAKAEGTSMEIAPTHEEQARLLVHYESKSGNEIPKGLRGDIMRHWEEQASNFAHRQTPRRKWALVFTMPGGQRRIFMDYAEWLELVSELQELP
jgi:hypothetical protein